MLTVMKLFVLILMFVGRNGLRSLNEPEMPVRSGIGVVVDATSMPMQCRCARTAHPWKTVARAATDRFVALSRLRPFVEKRTMRCRDTTASTTRTYTGPWCANGPAAGNRPQRTSVRPMTARTTLWALCTAIPIQALRYRFVGYARMNVSSSVAGITHGMWR
jgi:hypothetical protein